MKKLKLLIFALVCVFGLVGCSLDNYEYKEINTITDFSKFADMTRDGTVKIDVTFDNYSGYPFYFTIEDQEDIDEIMDIIFSSSFTKMESEMNGGDHTSLKIIQGEKEYNLHSFMNKEGQYYYSFATTDLLTIIQELAQEVGAFEGVDTPDGPHTTVPYGIYDNSLMMSQYPYQVTQKCNNKSKFEVIVPMPGVIDDSLYPKFPDVISLDYIKCDNLQKLFNTEVSEDYLKENFKAIWFIREEPITTDALEDIVYLDLFVENFEVYVTINYNSADVGGEAFSTYEELILIPNEWEEKIGKSSVNFNFYNHFYFGSKMTMSYNKMQEFKDAFRKQVLDNKYDDQMYREIYMFDVYGEYNNCLVATVTYDGYVHTDVCMPMVETFGDVTITYDARYPIYACYNSTLYSLTDAYTNGYLTIEDIRDIAEKINNQVN